MERTNRPNNEESSSPTSSVNNLLNRLYPDDFEVEEGNMPLSRRNPDLRTFRVSYSARSQFFVILFLFLYIIEYCLISRDKGTLRTARQ